MYYCVLHLRCITVYFIFDVLLCTSSKVDVLLCTSSSMYYCVLHLRCITVYFIFDVLLCTSSKVDVLLCTSSSMYYCVLHLRCITVYFIFDALFLWCRRHYYYHLYKVKCICQSKIMFINHENPILYPIQYYLILLILIIDFRPTARQAFISTPIVSVSNPCSVLLHSVLAFHFAF